MMARSITSTSIILCTMKYRLGREKLILTFIIDNRFTIYADGRGGGERRSYSVRTHERINSSRLSGLDLQREAAMKERREMG